MQHARRWVQPQVAQRAVMTGPVVDLVIGESHVKLHGRVAYRHDNQWLPCLRPLFKFREGDEVTIRVTNTLRVPTSIHWHGIILPYQMDGVPGISF